MKSPNNLPSGNSPKPNSSDYSGMAFEKDSFTNSEAEPVDPALSPIFDLPPGQNEDDSHSLIYNKFKFSTDFLYVYNDEVGGLEITRYFGHDSIVVVPPMIGDNRVVGISEKAFSGCGALARVVIPDSVAYIGEGAFCDCYSLTSIALSENLDTIGDYAFKGCDSLKSITIPDSVTRIGAGAFMFCFGLVGITIPKNVSAIGEEAFFSCSGLYNIEVDEQNPSFASENGILYTKDKATLLCCPAGKGGSVIIPDSVSVIAEGAFEGCVFLIYAAIPDSVTEIGEGAFYGCARLKRAEIPASVKRLGTGVFDGCPNLGGVSYNGKLYSIGSIEELYHEINGE